MGSRLFTKQICTKCQPGTVLLVGDKELKKPWFLPLSLHSGKKDRHGSMQMKFQYFKYFCKAIMPLWMFLQICLALNDFFLNYLDYKWLGSHGYHFQSSVDGFKKERLVEVDLTVLNCCEAGLSDLHLGTPKDCQWQLTQLPFGCRQKLRLVSELGTGNYTLKNRGKILQGRAQILRRVVYMWMFHDYEHFISVSWSYPLVTLSLTQIRGKFSDRKTKAERI